MNKRTSLILTVFCGLLLLAYACRRDLNHIVNDNGVPSTLLENAKIYHATNAAKFYYVNDQPYTLKPLWKDAWTTETHGQTVLVVPTLEASLKNRNVKIRRVFIFEGSQGRVSSGGIFEFVGRNYDVTANLNFLISKIGSNDILSFNGFISRYNINYVSTSTASYENGKKTNKIGGLAIMSVRSGELKISSSIFKRFTTTNFNVVRSGLKTTAIKTNDALCRDCPPLATLSPMCDHIFMYFCDYHNGILTDEWFEYMGPVNCRDANSSLIESSSSSSAPSGNEPPPYGGGSPTPPPPIPTKTDSLKKKHPCAARLVDSMITNNTYLATLIGPFRAGVPTPKIEWFAEDNFPFETPTGTPGNYATLLGETRSALDGYQTSSKVFLNKTMLDTSSTLLIKATIIHETIHAAINYNLALASYGLSVAPGDYGSWMSSMPAWATMRGLPPEYSNHREMMVSYFNSAVSQLSSMAPGYTHKEYVMAMMKGMDNPGTNSSGPMRSDLAAVYNGLLTTNSILPADQTAFNTKHMKATTAKLSKTGCP